MAPNVPKMTPSEFAAAYDLPDWRIQSTCLVGVFRAGSFTRGAEFVRRVAGAADELDHHPDVDLRYPGRLRIALTTHAARGLTSLDADLALRISALAAEEGLAVEPALVSRTEIAIDALDIGALLPFWRTVLGYVDDPRTEPGKPVDALVDPLRIRPDVWFQQMDAPRPQRNRVHLDVYVPEDAAETRLTAALAAGGRLLDDSEAPSFWVLADAEGNEVCICT